MELTEEQEKEIVRVKRKSVADIMVAIKVLLVVGDRSHLSRTEKHNLKVIEGAATTLYDLLNKSIVPDKKDK